ncbi:EamA family transporter [Microlunatus speluncae]|uniref:EamA family transporter n=1 Tax=Microlunatus speluncae TaxID=2594267 RepID=UPI0012664796|nr:EamA family transporter [Microlunatus speluncae]
MSTTEARPVEPRLHGSRSALPLALFSAMAFGLSGSLAKPLLETGWSPAAIVAVRIGGAFLVLLLPCLLLLRRYGRPTGRQGLRMIAYGTTAMALAQLCYFSAVQYVSVGVALLLEYSAPVLLIGWHWARTRTRPAPRRFVGAGLAILGLIFVLDVFRGATVHPLGLLWGLGAAVCLCCYFILGDEGAGGTPVPPLMMTTVGTGVGAAMIMAAGGLGVLPMTANTAPVSLPAADLPWWVPALLLVLITAVAAYLTGIVAVRRLGGSVASFVALTEVIFAVIFAAVLLADRLSPSQLIGGALVIAGIATVQGFRWPHRRSSSIWPGSAQPRSRAAAKSNSD